MGFIIAVTVGLVAGVIAQLTMPRSYPGGVFLSGLLGIAGAIVAWLLGSALGWTMHGQGPGILAAAVGAIVVLGIHRLVAGSHAH
jgi:uncharacterized membrane protein YeaQ/YmgE (transglycosylase-associated protein family)